MDDSKLKLTFEKYDIELSNDNVFKLNSADNNFKYDFVYSGNLWTLKCFKKFDSEVRKIKLIKGISSTIIRKMIVTEKNWQKLVPEEIITYIGKIDGAKRIKKIYCKGEYDVVLVGADNVKDLKKA